MSVKFPVVLYMRGALTVEDAASIRVAGVTFTDDGAMFAKASAKNGYVEEPGWALDSHGDFFEFVPERRHREWATPISFLVQFVRVEYSLSRTRRITVGELKERLSGIKDKFAEAPVAADLRQHLNSYLDEVEVSKEIVDAWGV